MGSVVIAFLVLTLVPAVAGAQGSQTNVSNTSPGNDRRQVVPFLDATYVAFGRARNDSLDDTITTFEADIVPNFIARQTFFDVMGQEETKTMLKRRTRGLGTQLFSEFRFAYSIAAVPMVKIRMFIKERSSPVRTPSYMPKGTGQLFLFKLQENKVDLFAVLATLGHHSNGQDGCLFAHQQRESDAQDADCIPEVAADRAPVPVNRKDGSFSTNYLQFGWRYRYIRLDPVVTSITVLNGESALRAALESDDWAAVLRESEKLKNSAGLSSESGLVDHWRQKLDAAVKAAATDPQNRGPVLDAAIALVAATNPVMRTSSRDITLGVDLELNPGDGRFLGGAGINPELKSRYGGTRVTLLAGIAKRIRGCDRAELKGFGKYIHQPAIGIPSWAGSVEGQCLFKQTNWGLFTRYYWGQDYYNLGFQDKVNRLQIGMTYSQEGFLRFRARPVSAQEAERVMQKAREQ